jgi:hypothetical protein
MQGKVLSTWRCCYKQGACANGVVVVSRAADIDGVADWLHEWDRKCFVQVTIFGLLLLSSFLGRWMTWVRTSQGLEH